MLLIHLSILLLDTEFTCDSIKLSNSINSLLASFFSEIKEADDVGEDSILDLVLLSGRGYCLKVVDVSLVA